MAKSKRQTPSEPKETKAPVEVEELVINAEVITTAPVPVEETKYIAPEALSISVTRDEEGRVIFKVPGLPNRIAGNDIAIPETLRQLGEDLVKRKLV